MPGTNDERTSHANRTRLHRNGARTSVERQHQDPATLAQRRTRPPYIKLSKAIRYPVDEIVTYEQAIRQGMSHEVPLPSLNEAPPVVESPAPVAPEPKRYYLSEAFALIAQYGSLEAAEAALTEARDETQG